SGHDGADGEDRFTSAPMGRRALDRCRWSIPIRHRGPHPLDVPFAPDRRALASDGVGRDQHGAFWTMTTAVAEATVITTAAVGGTTETFTSWWAFAEGKAIGFAVLALGIALVGSNEARDPVGATPAWTAWVATVAGVASFLGWALGMWLEIRPANLL